MSTPDERARDRDRDAAIEIVEAAWADGQIIEADRDKRVEQLLQAQTLAEVRMLTHDLQPPTVNYGPPSPSPSPGSGHAPDVGVPGAVRSPSRAMVLVPLVVVVLVAVAVVGGIVAFTRSTVDEATRSVPGIPDLLGGSEAGSDVDVLSVEGYQELLAAVREVTGSTTAFSAVLYPTYAVVELPVDATTNREEYWYWDGSELTANDVKTTSTSPRTDLADLDPEVLVDLVRKVRQKMPDETSWYAIVRAPDEAGAVVWVYASNEYQESVYLGARPDGRITWDSTEH